MLSRTAKLLVTFAALAMLNMANANDFKEIDNYLGELQRAAAFDGIVVISNGDEIVHEQSFGFANYEQSTPIDLKTRFLIGDLAQIVTRAAIGRLIDENKLSFQSRLADFLPDFPDARRITVLHLIEHTSGVVDTRDLAWINTAQAETLDGLISGLATERLRFKPGVRRLPSNGGYALLAKIIEVVSEQSYAEFIRTEFSDKDYTSLVPQDNDDAVTQTPVHYMPGHTFGERTHSSPQLARVLVPENSLRLSAPDLTKFIRNAYSGELLSESSSSVIFPVPENRILAFSSEISGAFAQVRIDLNTEKSLVLLSSNVAQPANLAENVLTLNTGAHLPFRAITPASKRTSRSELEMYVGQYRSRNIEAEIQLTESKEALLFVQGQIATAFSATEQGDYYLSFFDWLCRFSAYNTEFVCQERSSVSTAPVLFERM